MKPLISYYGGKQRIASRIVDVLPPHTVYAEPFAGGAAVLFAKGLPPITNSHYYREVINDTDKRLITMYRVAVEQPDEFERLVMGTLYSKADHERAENILRSPDGSSDLVRAWAYYVQAMQSFSNQPLGSWSRRVLGHSGVYSWQGQNKSLCKRLERIAAVHIDCVNALDFIDYWDSPHTCFYCDPPYPDANQGHYGGYTQADFQALVDKLANCQASFVLSNYDNPAVPTEWPKVEIMARMSAANGRHLHRLDTERTEVLWIVDRSANTADELKSHLWTPSRGFPYRQTTMLPLFAYANGRE